MRKIERRMIYGHTVSKKRIEEKYPFEEVEIDCSVVKRFKGTVTFDIHLAYELRSKGFNVVHWGAIYRQKHVFLIDKPTNTLPLPF